MKRRSGKISTGLISWLVILTISLVFFPHTALAVEYTFTSIDVPGAGGTLAYGINDAGNIVGYHDGVGSFLDVGGNFTPIIYPDAEPIFTFAYGINDAGNIVGFYVIVDATVRSHGFLYAGNNFTSINYPGASSTYAFGINDAGNIVGYYQDPEDHGFLLDVQGNFTSINYPGARQTEAYGINHAGNIVGNYVDATGQHGFLLDVQGNFTSITYPGGYNTIALGINDAGNIVGAYTGGEGSEFGDHGFLYAGGTFTSINYPGVSPYYVIEAHGINNAGYIVGFYNDNAPGDHGFLATPVPPPPGKVPSLNEWGSIILSLVLAAGAIWLLRKRQSIG